MITGDFSSQTELRRRLPLSVMDQEQLAAASGHPVNAKSKGRTTQYGGTRKARRRSA
jgi:hypothetical protein